jgi:hypothetical protein
MNVTTEDGGRVITRKNFFLKRTSSVAKAVEAAVHNLLCGTTLREKRRPWSAVTVLKSELFNRANLSEDPPSHSE